MWWWDNQKDVLIHQALTLHREDALVLSVSRADSPVSTTEWPGRQRRS